MKGEKKREKRALDRSYVIRFVLLMATGFLYTRIMRFTGYVVATPVFIASSMLIFNQKKWHRIVIVSVVTTAVLYTVFRMAFRVPLPRFTLW